MITAEMRARFDRETAKYPVEQRQSAVMACLSIVQHEVGTCQHGSESDVG
jgi:NADH-quinone oxidoreductase subunit E